MVVSVPPCIGLTFVAPFFIILLLYIYHCLFTSRYWSKRNVPHVKPIFLLGNFWRTRIFEHSAVALSRMYKENEREKLVGFWIYQHPCLMILDLNLIKKIFIRDFEYFHARNFVPNPELEPLSENLFAVNGKQWKDLRVKLGPAFSLAKIKTMFPTVLKCGQELRDYLRKPSSTGEEIGVKEVMARFTTDIIGSCGFGIGTNSIKNPDSEFRKHGKSVFDKSWRNKLAGYLITIHPNLLRLLKIPLFPKETSDFFLKVVRDTIAHRKASNTTRNDFLQHVMKLMDEGNVEKEGKEHKSDARPFTETYAAAQCFIFFLAGFETSSTALTFGLYELAFNPDVQRKLLKEIDEALSEGEITYDKISEMQYLDMVVHEILRMHPPAAYNSRRCTADYRIPELNVTIQKGTVVFVSILGMHHDPKYYPNPERFDPERFSPEEKAKRDGMAFSPFGEGPRSCIGNRFGLLQMKIGLISVLRENTVEVGANTPVPLKMHRTGLIYSPEGEIPLVFKKRT